MKAVKTLIDALASKALAVALLAALFVAGAAATFFPLPAALSSVYHSPWFFALLGAFGLNTLACTISELLRRKVPAGFLLLHLGSVLVLGGGAYGWARGEKGRVAVPEKGSVSYFYGEWKGADRLVLEGGETRVGRFEGFERGDVLFSARGERPRWIPLAEVRELALDPVRPGRRLEVDTLVLAGNERVPGFVQSVDRSGIRIRTESEEKEVPLDRVMVLEMGDPAARPLGYAVRLERFSIEYYGEAAFRRLYVQRPDAEEPAELRAEEGAEADLGGGFRVKVLRFLPDAVVDRATRALENRSGEMRNPAVELEVAWPGGREVRPVFEREMPGSHHRPAGASGVSARLITPVKAYLSDVSVLEEGAVARTARIEVNAPLAYKGYSIYQSSYEEQGGRFRSVFEVVRDPGLPFAYAGFAMLVAGAALTCWVKPLLAAFRTARDAAEPAPDPGPGSGAESAPGAPGGPP